MKRDSEALTAEEMFALESNAEYLGVSLLQLMECAGKAVADKVAEKLKKKFAQFYLMLMELKLIVNLKIRLKVNLFLHRIVENTKCFLI